MNSNHFLFSIGKTFIEILLNTLFIIMKSEFSNLTTISNDEKEEELIDGLAFYVAESASAILSIKQCVY